MYNYLELWLWVVNGEIWQRQDKLYTLSSGVGESKYLDFIAVFGFNNYEHLSVIELP